MGNLTRKAVWTLAVLVWLMPATAAASGSGPSKTDSLLAASSSSGKSQRVIIRTKPGAQVHVGRRLEAHGDRVDKIHKLVPAVSAHVSPKRLAELSSDPDVEWISTDAEVSADASNSKQARNALPAVPNVQRLLAVSGWFSGATTTVAVVDSGIAPVADLDARIVGFFDFTGGTGAVAAAPSDQFGHGTHVAGLIGSTGKSSGGAYAGVAPGVKLLGLKVLDKNGLGRTSNVLAALEFAVANKERFGVKVVNLSLGHPVYEPAATDPLVIAVERAVRAGLVVVVSAGNHGTNPHTGKTGFGGISSPGNAPSAITVGAGTTGDTIARVDDRVAAYSSRGPSWFDGIAKPDVVAPGDGLISNAPLDSTLERAFPDLAYQSGAAKFLQLSGASMATAVVSGLAAVVLDANATGARNRAGLAAFGSAYVPPPALTPHAVKAILQYTATPLRAADGTRYDSLTQGTGLVNGHAAATVAYCTDTSKDAGSYWATSYIPHYTRFDGVVEPWAEAVIWGTRELRGSSLLQLHQYAWDENIVWGTGEYNIRWATLDEDENIVWGTGLGGLGVVWLGNVQLDENIVWGTFNWGENIVWGTSLLGYFDGFNIVWGTFNWSENIVWGTLDDENIVWGTSEKKVTVLGASGGVQ